MGVQFFMHAGEVVFLDHDRIVFGKPMGQSSSHVNGPLVQKPPDGFRVLAICFGAIDDQRLASVAMP